jgi:hypothetical protein
MAVRAHWPEILMGVHKVLGTNLGQWTEMMDMNVAIGNLSIRLAEVKAANAAFGTMHLQAPTAGLRVSLVCVDPHSNTCALPQERCFLFSDLFRKQWRRALDPT